MLVGIFWSLYEGYSGMGPCLQVVVGLLEVQAPLGLQLSSVRL